MRIIVVDDAIDMQVLIRAALEDHGIDVDVAGSVAEAQQLDWSGVAAAVVDWMMPIASGLVLVDWLAEHHPDVDVVVFTGAPIAVTEARVKVVTKDYDFPRGLLTALGVGP